jgi:hypothetical protein
MRVLAELIARQLLLAFSTGIECASRSAASEGPAARRVRVSALGRSGKRALGDRAEVRQDWRIVRLHNGASVEVDLQTRTRWGSFPCAKATVQHSHHTYCRVRSQATISISIASRCCARRSSEGFRSRCGGLASATCCNRASQSANYEGAGQQRCPTTIKKRKPKKRKPRHEVAGLGSAKSSEA